MQLQNMCKKGARIFQRIRPKMERLGNSSSTPKNRERDYHNDSRHVTGVLLWKKWWVTHLQSFEDLVFASERIDVGLKRGKFNHLAWTNEKTGANEEGENEGETHAMTAIPIRPSFPPTQQCHYSANNKPPPYPPPSYPQRPSLNQPQSLSTALPMTNTTFSTNQKHQPRSEFCSEKACRIHPNSSVLCWLAPISTW